MVLFGTFYVDLRLIKNILIIIRRIVFGVYIFKFKFDLDISLQQFEKLPAAKAYKLPPKISIKIINKLKEKRCKRLKIQIVFFPS